MFTLSIKLNFCKVNFIHKIFHEKLTKKYEFKQKLSLLSLELATTGYRYRKKMDQDYVSLYRRITQDPEKVKSLKCKSRRCKYLQRSKPRRRIYAVKLHHFNKLARTYFASVAFHVKNSSA